ncbi:unnamed protein product [Spirodela intermedia]|uniref:Uncharacterized protein n=1 Tax=Spirodela intermedia TaxID=51605 RepID=A0A7I8KED9_SPIIN|nr:unnamed protein product [Spirodela intermedia]
MSSSSKFLLNNEDMRLHAQNNVTSLNPNAAEFVPYVHRSPSGSDRNIDMTRLNSPRTSGKTVLDRPAFNISDNYDDEARQYWDHQLPDDITPDFKVMVDEGSQSAAALSLSKLSLNDGMKMSRTAGGQFLGKQQEVSLKGSTNIALGRTMGYSSPMYAENFSTTLMDLATNPWDKHFMRGDRHVGNYREREHAIGDSSASFLGDLLTKKEAVKAMEFLASRFPGFAVEKLMEAYLANGCDLNSTTEKLTRLELQVNGFNMNRKSRSFVAPNLGGLEFPVRSLTESPNGFPDYGSEDSQRAPISYQSIGEELLPFSNSPMNGESRLYSFASAAGRLALEDPGRWKYERNGSKRTSQSLSGFPDKLPGLETAYSARFWRGTGDTMARVCSEMRGEAGTLARLQNACPEQSSTQAYAAGSEEGPSREVTLRTMKEAQERARECVLQQRDLADHLIPLEGLRVEEAIRALRHELGVLRWRARLARRRLQVVVTGGVAAAAAVRQVLLDEGLRFSEDLPGLLRVLVE